MNKRILELIINITALEAFFFMFWPFNKCNISDKNAILFTFA